MDKVSYKTANELGLSRRSFVKGGLGLMGAAALTGCGSSSSSGSSGSSSGSASTDAATESDTSATVTFALSSAWDTLNPYLSSTSFSSLVCDKIFDRPVYINEDFEVEPRAASSWELEDETTLIFHLDEGATWHDGEPVTADDWVFTLQTIASSEATLVSRAFTRYLEGCDVSGIETEEGALAVEARDDYTVACTMNKAYDLDSFIESFGMSLYILPEHVFEGMTPAEIFDDTEYWEAPIGSGPCVFEEMVSGSSITLSSFENFELGQPQFAQLVFLVSSQSNFANSIMSGEADLTYIHLVVDDAMALEGEDGITITRNDHATSLQTLAYNNYQVSQNMRLAINYAIDKPTLVEQYYANDAELVETIVRPDNEYYKGNSVERDVDKAAEYFQAAIDAGEWDADRTFELGVNTDSREDQGALIAQNLEEIGLSCNVTMYDSSTMWSYLYDGTIDGCLMALLPGNNILGSRAYFESMYKDTLYFHVDVSEFDDIIADFEVAADEDEKQELMYEFQDLELEYMPYTYICAQYPYAGTSTRLQNADPFASDQMSNAVWKWTVEA